MINPEELDALVRAVQTIASVLAGLGLPGLIALALAGPACVLITVLLLTHRQALATELAQERANASSEAALEAYRKDTQEMLRDIGAKHLEVKGFYERNVDLVKNYERMTDSLQALVTNNTRALERLITIIETERRRHE